MQIQFPKIIACAAMIVAAAPAAHAQLFVTGVYANLPDPNGVLPAFNIVPGAGIPSWSSGLAQSVLTHGQSYEYCVSLASGTAVGKASVAYKITRGTAVIQSETFVKPSQYSVGSGGVWYYCAGYHVLPNSPGAATLTGVATFTATGTTTPVVTKLSVPLLLE